MYGPVTKLLLHCLLESLDLGVFVCYCGSVNNMNRIGNILKWILNIRKINLGQLGCVY